MIERSCELEQVHTRRRGHKNTKAVFYNIRRRRPGFEKEISRCNKMVEALPIAHELKTDKISYELLAEGGDRVSSATFLQTRQFRHHFKRCTVRGEQSWRA
ncbi:hypothetical protein V1519DRAFT_444809 [Lipomyces tetrasporus]